MVEAEKWNEYNILQFIHFSTDFYAVYFFSLSFILFFFSFIPSFLLSLSFFSLDRAWCIWPQTSKFKDNLELLIPLPLKRVMSKAKLCVFVFWSNSFAIFVTLGSFQAFQGSVFSFEICDKYFMICLVWCVLETSVRQYRPKADI